MLPLLLLCHSGFVHKKFTNEALTSALYSDIIKEKRVKIMKNKKRIIIAVVVALSIMTLAVGTVFALGIGNKNEKNLRSQMDTFTKKFAIMIGRENIVETKSVYGKLNGNGNGIQYFGAVLVRRDSAEAEDLDELIRWLGEDFEVVECCAQENSDITSKYLEHQTLKYKTAISPDDDFITIWFYNSYYPDSDQLDIAGH